MCDRLLVIATAAAFPTATLAPTQSRRVALTDRIVVSRLFMIITGWRCRRFPMAASTPRGSCSRPASIAAPIAIRSDTGTSGAPG